MSLDLSKLEKFQVREKKTVARCPACAEAGGDSKSVHLVIWPDGRYGCAAHPKDSSHRKRIWALIGDKKPKEFVVKQSPQGIKIASKSIKHLLWDAWDGYSKVTTPTIPLLGTLGTDIFESMKDKNRDCLDQEIPASLNQTLNQASQPSQITKPPLYLKTSILPGTWCTICWYRRGRAIPLNEENCFLCKERDNL